MVKNKCEFEIPATKEDFVRLFSIFREADLMHHFVFLINGAELLESRGLEYLDFRMPIVLPRILWSSPIVLNLRGEGRLEETSSGNCFVMELSNSHDENPSIPMGVELLVTGERAGELLNMTMEVTLENGSAIPDWFVKQILNGIIPMGIKRIPALVKQGEPWTERILSEPEAYRQIGALFDKLMAHETDETPLPNPTRERSGWMSGLLRLCR